MSSECEDVDPNDPNAVSAGGAARAPLQQQPLPQSASATPGGPPNMPPPPAPSRIPSQPSGNAPDLSLSFGKGPQRGVSAPASPAKSRESLLQRVQSLTGAARDQGASIIGTEIGFFLSKSYTKATVVFLLVKCHSRAIVSESI